MHYFFLGNTPDLSLLELRNLYPGEFILVTKDIASYDAELDLNSLSRLGGTTKVAESLQVVSPKKLISTLVELITSESQKNIALTDYASLDLGRAVFHELKDKVERSIRFVSMETGPHELLMLSHQHVLELNLIPSGDDVIIAKTVWIYDAEDWVSRDRNKPYRDIKRGMLPPKVARIMVNLATGGKSGLTLADPFCGTGTVLSEAMMLGYDVIGSDTNPDAITGSKSNLEWLKSAPNSLLKSLSYHLHELDATHFNEKVERHSLLDISQYSNGIGLISHVPCSTSCKYSKRLAYQFYQSLKKVVGSQNFCLWRDEIVNYFFLIAEKNELPEIRGVAAR